MKKYFAIIVALLSVCMAYAANDLRAFPTKVLVVLAEFSDVSFDVANTKAAYDDFFNSSSYDYNGATGSVQKYFKDQSYGKFVPQFDVVGPVTLSDKRLNYGANDEYGDDVAAEAMITQACELAHAQGTNFAPYDVNGDGFVDAVVIVYAGQGETDKQPDYVYPMAGVMEDDVILDNKFISLYACVPELNEKQKRAGIGETVYQFSHILGLPTLSDTEGGDEKTLGDWDVMDHGCYNNGGNTPAAYSAYERFYLGWVEPILLNEPMNVRLGNLNTSGECAIVTRTGQSNMLGDNPDPREFFILENRQQTGWDKYLPGHGMLITKIDYVKSRWAGDEVNILIKGKPSLLVDLIEADGKEPKYKADNLTNGYFGKQGDAFPSGATGKTMFSNKWDVASVSEKSGIITFLFNGGVETGCTVTFYAGGNGTAAKTDETETAPFAGVTLPNVTPKTGYTFLGWATRKNSTNPDAGQPGDKFYPMSDCSVFAVMKDNTKFWVDYTNVKGVEIGDYFDFNGAYVKTNDIHDIAVSFGKKEGYVIPAAATCVAKVECGGKTLPNAVSFKKDSLFVTIAAEDIVSDIYITIQNSRYQDENGCLDYEHVFTKACGIGGNDLSGYEWQVKTGNPEAEITFENNAVKFGSGSKPSKGVSFYTTETAGCGVKKVEVEAFMASNGDAMLDVYLVGNFMGNSEELTTTSTTYTYELEEPQSGSLMIAFTNSAKAIYVKRIAVFYEYLDPEKQDDPIIPDPGTDPQAVEHITVGGDAVVYDLQGRRVLPTQPGFYIIYDGQNVSKVIMR